MKARSSLLTALATGLVFSSVAVLPPAADAAPHAAAAVQHRVLFDNTKAETAGNADWIISTSIPDPTGQNPSPSTDTDWTGAISSWGVALQKTGQYSLKTLGTGNSITYGTTSNPLDLANFDTFVLPEPNILLTAAEKTAVMKFVQAGGGLFLISDHTGSDRNNDGKDSPAIINDLLTNNGVDNSDPFGFSVDLKNIASDHPVAVTDAANPVLNGAFGTVRHSLIANGTTFTLKPADNPNVKGLLYLSTVTPGNTGAFFVTSTFGSGRVAIWGDSSTIDDGTGQPGNTLFNGWADPTADNAALGLNATAWLASGATGTPGGVTVSNPGNQTTAAGAAVSLQIQAADSAGGTLAYSASGLPSGLTINRTTGVISGTPATSGSSTVTVTATDSTGPVGTTSFTWLVGSTGGSCTPAQLLGNPGFETGTAAPWTASAKVLANSAKEPTRTGTWDAWLDGYGTATTNTLAQTVSLPSGCSTYALSFWLHIDTAETSSTVFDTLGVQVLNGSGTVLSTLANFSNANAASGYTQHTYSLAPYAGQTVTLRFTGVEDSSAQTSFVVDDTALNVS
ncbi:MAG: Hydrolase [Amycolatopsis sp.]|uniref:putative Ig domain-containing protein n=1 Tax=Amycolatopsis sp. TaxID=37632 RepID=UPI00260E4C1F|nr:putative Ig domain-containing protein [Amycolatopsis sp.]MCU1679465.1 Hydrolase [Amycolatopsis sp.]